MRIAFAAIALVGAAAFASPAMAGSRGFTAEVNAPLSSPIGAVTVGVNEDIVTTNRLRLRRGDRDYIGPRDAADLTEALEIALAEGLQGVGALNPMAGQPVATLEARIVSVTPTNPGLTEHGHRNNVHHASIGFGGAEIEAVLRAPDGREIATYTYRWFEDSSQLRTGAFARGGAWYHAELAFNRFAEELADELS